LYRAELALSGKSQICKEVPMRVRSFGIGTALIVALLWPAGAANAQNTTGSLHGKAVADDGAPMPGVIVTIDGLGTGGVQVTDGQGEFSFIGLFQGQYSLTVTLEGFQPATSNITVAAGRVSAIDVMIHAPVALSGHFAIVVEQPRLDVHYADQRTTRSASDLQNIPAARDPWAVLQQTPGVLPDRINVGDSESTHPSNYVAPGSSADASLFVVDGIVITDPTNPGASPAYYDFDLFDAIQVTTGGRDTTIASGGVVLNTFTKRGTNVFRGSGQYRLQPFSPSRASLAHGAYPLDSRTSDVRDYDITLGGPLLKDRLWFFSGAGGQRGTWNFGAADGRFDSPGSFNSGSVNVHGLARNVDRFNLFVLHSHKSQLGPASDPGRARSSLWNGHASLKTFKVENSHIFTSNLYLTGLYSIVRSGLDRRPAAGNEPVVYGSDEVWRNGFIVDNSNRPQTTYQVDGASFFTFGSLRHELKFGAGSREAKLEDATAWPQGFGYLEEPDGSFARFFVGNSVTTRTNQFTDAYVQHTVIFDDVTTSFGIRLEHDTGTDGPNTRSGSALVSLVRPVTQPAQLKIHDNNFAPRLGFTWAPALERPVVVTGGYGLYYDQLPMSLTALATGVRGGTALDGAFVFNDSNQLLGTFNPVENLTDPRLRATRMSELFGGVDVALGPNVSVGVRYTQRGLENQPVLRDLVLDGLTARVATTDDTFLFGHLTGFDPKGQAVSIPVFYFKLSVTPFPEGGQLLTNSFAKTDYRGASLTLNRRLANRWMLRGNFTVNDWTWNVPVAETAVRPFGLTVGAGQDGEVAAPHSLAPDAAGVYMNSRFSYNVNGLYQIAGGAPRGIDASFNVSGHQGYPMPFYAAEGGRNLQAGDLDDYRFPDVNVLDVGVRKTFPIDKMSVGVGVDCFNVLQAQTTTQVQMNLSKPGAGQVMQTLSPRVARLGIRLTF
jgi:hypothetical protein